MTYSCFPDQSPFPLPPGVTTPPAAPELIDNGPQLPPNSIEAADDLDLCTLAGLLDSLPDDQVFVPELEDPATPILPPFKEIFYVDAPIRLTESWFFIPGPNRLDAGSALLRIQAVARADNVLNALIQLTLDASERVQFFKTDAAVHPIAVMNSGALLKVRLFAAAANSLPGSAIDGSMGVEFGFTVTS